MTTCATRQDFEGMDPVRHFSTDSACDDDRPLLFQAEMHRLFSVRLAVRPSSTRPLSARMSAYCGRNLRFAALRFSPHTTHSLVASEPSDARLLVSVHKEGVVMVSQGGRESRIEPGDLFVLDPARPFNIETGSISSNSIYLPTSAVRALVPHLDQLTALPIRGGQGVGAVFRAAADELIARAEQLDEATADRVGEALPFLLAPALAALGGRTSVHPGALRQLHKRRILHFVRDHLADPALDAPAIAAGVGLSPRHVYKLFSDEGEPLMKRVWSERLDRCRRDLEDAVLRRRTVSEVAYSWGFSDVSHFSRAFKQRFGVTPRDCRPPLARS